jgi:hypothetical protein
MIRCSSNVKLDAGKNAARAVEEIALRMQLRHPETANASSLSAIS